MTTIIIRIELHRLVDINGDLYMVLMSDGLRVDSFYEDQLERAW